MTRIKVLYLKMYSHLTLGLAESFYNVKIGYKPSVEIQRNILFSITYYNIT